MDAIANSVEDKLIDGLSFKHEPSASYVTGRHSSTFFPAGSNIYSTSGGTKLIKISLTGDNWLDPGTFRVMFDLHNLGTAAQSLRVLGGPHSFFRRVRVLANGTVISDLDDYNRTHEMFYNLISKNSKRNIDSEGFGQIDWDHRIKLTVNSIPGIEAGDSRTVLFQPLAGIFTQNKMIPLRLCPITIELELVNDATDPIVSHLAGGTDGFTGENTSLLWQIENVQAKADVVDLDKGFENQFVQHLLDGNTLSIPMDQYISQTQSLLNGENGQKSVRLNISRNMSSLKSVFVTFENPAAEVEVQYKPWNSFYSPMKAYTNASEKPLLYESADAYGKHNSLGEFEFYLQVGSKRYPETPIRSHAEGFYQLRKCLGIQSSNLHSIDIDPDEYRHRKFILGTDLEKVLSVSHTGLSTKHGDMLSILAEFKDPNAIRYPHSVQTVLHASAIVEIGGSGVSILD